MLLKISKILLRVWKRACEKGGQDTKQRFSRCPKENRTDAKFSHVELSLRGVDKITRYELKTY